MARLIIFSIENIKSYLRLVKILKKGKFLIFFYFFRSRGVKPIINEILSPPPPRKKIRKKVKIKLNKELQTE